MLVSGDKGEIRRLTGQWRLAGQRVGLVPTMGALHEGHLSLVRLSRAACQKTLATIFVNPAQFGPNEDLSKYPRTLDKDLALLKDEGVDAVFTPDEISMYRAQHLTWINVERLSSMMCGLSRPTHFRGVSTIVTKLCNIVQPDEAFFGQKDYQQATIIRQMVLDLDMPVTITVGPIVRESDGLAMSSRNRFLSVEQRQAALVLVKALREIVHQAQSGQPLSRCQETLSAMIVSEPLARLDYAVIVDADSLQPATDFDSPTLAALAVHFGTTRLIDNMLIPSRSLCSQR